jgi:bifunctional UDP-N-acetylglucosamine pyrophosphorylase/glucosamine-1-phosphate N-acetyltransferase
MMSELPKVAHVAAGRTLVGWVLEAVSPLNPASTVVVVGHGAQLVRDVLPDGVIVSVQGEQLGTGHATQVGIGAIPDLHGNDTVVVLYGDMPLLTSGLIAALARLGDDVAAMATAELDDPAGYGRVIRDGSGAVVAVVEDRDCSAEQRSIHEINAGVYAFRADALVASLGRVSNDNLQGEYYLTDVVGILTSGGDKLRAVEAEAQEVMGINSQDQLTVAARELQRRTNQRLMESGVRMIDPETTYVESSVEIEPGAYIYPGVHLEGNTRIGADARVGPDVFILDSTVGAGATVWYSVLRGATVGPECEVGPYASLRPGTVMERGSKLGTFVEAKNTNMGEGAKAPHLTYLGDATIGARSNIGAGTVTCNYDGHDKHPTEIGADVFIGSATMLVAPLSIGDKAVTGAGSVITKDVAEGALAVERGDQREIPGYASRRKARKTAIEAED